MPIKNYEEAVNWLFEQFPSYQNIGASAYKPGLSHVYQLAEAFGNPQNQLKFVHVAGSNGKGSVCSLLASILTEAGYKTGLFTSPHLVDFTERIRVNGRCIDKEFVIHFCQKVQALDIDFEPSFFEITWVMALCYYQDQQTDICIIEVGLGGRLDATNIIVPELSVITSISLEHQQFLGDTLELISAEKAGIIKQNVPVVIGELRPSLVPVFEKIAENQNAEIIWRNQHTDPPQEFPLLGEYQKQNWQTVQASLENLSAFPIEDQHIQLGLQNLHQNTGFYGRLQVIEENPRVILDVSHNVDGIEQTLSFFQNEISEGKLILVYGTSADKDLNAILPLFPDNCPLFFSEFSNARSLKLEEWVKQSRDFGTNSENFHSPNEALKKAKSLATKDQTILVFGSFFLIHEFLK